MPRQFYDSDDSADEPMFRTQRQVGWDHTSERSTPRLPLYSRDNGDDTNDEDEPAFLGVPSARKPLALPAPPAPCASSTPRGPAFPVNPKTPYEVLGVSEDVSQDDLKAAYKKAAMRWHPDRYTQSSERQVAEATRRFQLIGEAYAVLGDGQCPFLAPLDYSLQYSS